MESYKSLLEERLVGGQLNITSFGTYLPQRWLTGVQEDCASLVPVAIVDLQSIGTATSDITKPPVLGRDIVAVVDVSGSMSTSMSTVRSTLSLLAESLSPQDRLSIVTFSTTAQLFWPMTPMNNDMRETLNYHLNQLTANDQTNISAGLELGLTQFSGLTHHERADETRLKIVLLLSDGDANVGVSKAAEMSKFVETKLPQIFAKNPSVVPYIVIHSFGYTANHNAELMRTIATLGPAGAGRYYYLQSRDDIGSGIGDALGSLNNVAVMGLSLRIPDATDMTFYEGVASTASSGKTYCTVGYLGSGEQKNILLTASGHASVVFNNILNHANTAYVPVLCSLSVQDPATGAWKSHKDVEIVCPLLPTESEDYGPVSVHLATHVLRVRTSEALYALGTQRSSAVNLGEAVHADLIALLTEVRQQQAQLDEHHVGKHLRVMLATDENILSQLENDLGVALEAHYHGRVTVQDRIRQQQYSHEHAQQRSASSTTHLRATYTTPDQEAMRAKFARDSGIPTAAAAAVSSNSARVVDELEKVIEKESIREKQNVPVQDATVVLSAEECAKRVTVDMDCVCFVMHDNWRECNLGMGLLVHPRTMRERYRGLIPQVDMIHDYVSVDAFNRGASAVVNQYNLDTEQGKKSILPSSTRSKINAWLPLYINPTHWKYVRRYAPAALSIIATGANDKFQPMHAVWICSKLMCQAVVQLMNGKMHMSDHAIQQYCDIHRLFLELLTEYPDIAQSASNKLADFVNMPWKRGRDFTPDIGNLIQYLSVTDKVTWNEFRDAYIQESQRRSARWLHKRLEELGLPALTEEIVHRNDAQLVDLWYKASKVSMDLMLFNLMFLEHVARPSGCTIDDVKKRYDRTWGRLSEATLQQLKSACKDIQAVDSMSEAYKRAGVAHYADIHTLADDIRWALAHEKELPVPHELRTCKDEAKSYQLYAQHEAWRKLQESKSNAVVSANTRVAATDRVLSKVFEYGRQHQQVTVQKVPRHPDTESMLLSDVLTCLESLATVDSDPDAATMLSENNGVWQRLLKWYKVKNNSTAVNTAQGTDSTTVPASSSSHPRRQPHLVYTPPNSGGYVCSIVRQGADAMDVPHNIVVKNMFFRYSDACLPVLVVSNGTDKIDLDVIEDRMKQLNISTVNVPTVGQPHYNHSMGLARPGDISLYTGYTDMSFPVFGLITDPTAPLPLTVFVNRRLISQYNNDIVYTVPGSRRYELGITAQDLLELMGGVANVHVVDC